MKVFKFGGGIIKDADSIKKISELLKQYKCEKIIIVVSALGKTTNMLESLISDYLHNKSQYRKSFQKLKLYHLEVIKDLSFENEKKMIWIIDNYFDQLNKCFEEYWSYPYEVLYDQIVSYGEVFSTLIVSAYLNEKGSQNKWLDARQIVKTSDDHRAGEVDLSLSSTKLHEQIDNNKFSIFIIQGFIGSDKNGLTTTLGREGSDYTAAVVAYMVNASELIFWKDVRGIYNADPKHFVEAKLIKELNYKNASELTDLGAKVLHHRTIQPLKERNILVQLRSFLEPNKAGTFIKQDFKDNKELPVIVHRLNKIILKIKARDLSSISDLDRKEILEKIKMHHLEVNYENFLSGTYYVCLNHFVEPVISLRDDLQKFFKLELFFGVTMVKIKYSNADINAQIVKHQEIIAQDIVNGIQFFFF